MPFEAFTADKVRGKDGKLAAQWLVQCRARSHSISQVPTVVSQRQGWLCSDRSWRMGLRVLLLCRVVA